MAGLPPLSQLTRLLVRSDDGAALLGRLHEHLLEAANGIASVIVHVDPGTGSLRASSGCRVEYLPLAPWEAAADERAAIDRALTTGRVVPLQFGSASRAGDLLRARAGLVVPLVGQDGPCGAVLVGIGAGAAPNHDEGVLAVADAFVLALERARTRRASDRLREVLRVVGAFRQAAPRWTDLNRALAELCRAAAPVFAAERAAAWLHDREARELVLAGASDSGHGQPPDRVAVADALSLASHALHRPGPDIVDGGGVHDRTGPALVVPLRGRRRALGVLQLDGIHLEPEDHPHVLVAAHALGDGLAPVIETVVLIEQVVSGHWRLDGLLETIDEMAVLCDAELRVVQGNQAFAARTGVNRDDLAGRELRDLVGDPLARWAHDAATGGESSTTATDAIGGPFGAPVRVHAGAIRGVHVGAGGLVLVVRDAPPATA